MAFATKNRRIIFTIDQSGKGFSEVGALIIAAVNAMKNCIRHWHDDIDFGNVEASRERGMKPRHEVVPQPKMTIEFKIEDEAARLIFESECAARAVEVRPCARGRAIFAEVVGFKAFDGSPADRTTSHL